MSHVRQLNAELGRDCTQTLEKVVASKFGLGHLNSRDVDGNLPIV